MAFVNAEGKSISYECSELIVELKQDIEEFGAEKIVAVWCKDYEGVILYTNYDFIVDGAPINESELVDGEFIKEMSMGDLLVVMEKQNKICM